jgi:hypothetical protein
MAEAGLVDVPALMCHLNNVEAIMCDIYIFFNNVLKSKKKEEPFT